MVVDASPLLLDAGEVTCEADSPSKLHPSVKHVCSLSLGSCVANLVLAVLGAGQLVLPYAMGQLGLGFGICALVIFTALSAHSCYTLSVYELHFTAGAPVCIESYAELVVRMLGTAGSKVCTVLLALYAWGGALSFMVILKGELASLSGLPEATCLITLGTVLLWPLSSAEDLSALKATSPLGCAAAVFITAVVLLSTQWTGEAPLGARFCHGPSCRLDTDHASAEASLSIEWWPSSFLEAAAALPLLSFALNSSWAYIPILCTLKGRSSPVRYASLITISNLIILANYLLIAAYGYGMFCGRVAANILDSLGATADPSTAVGFLVLLARVALSVQLSLALPMRFFVTRRTVGGQVTGLAGRIALSAALVGSATLLAILPLSLAMVLSVVSSVCASMIIYILPALLDLKFRIADPLLPRGLRLCCSVVSLLVGCFVLVGGLAGNLLGLSVGAR
jgi:amino acid permease